VRMAIWMQSYAILDETFAARGLDLMIRKATRTDHPGMYRLIKRCGGQTIVSENRRRCRLLQNEFAGEETK
jgi:predicted  nucleic acid-binding Zn ribbon protein